MFFHPFDLGDASLECITPRRTSQDLPRLLTKGVVLHPPSLFGRPMTLAFFAEPSRSQECNPPLATPFFFVILAWPSETLAADSSFYSPLISTRSAPFHVSDVPDR